MSQHMLVHNGAAYQYGYDSQLFEYYLTKVDEDDGYIPLCGPLSTVQGNKVNFYAMLEQEGLLEAMPTIHRYAVAVDIPF